jgi:protein tyrosine phosphatase
MKPTLSLCEFRALPLKMSDARLCNIGSLKCNISKNRYPDVLALDRTLVPLFERTQYINANFINIKGRQPLIACQAPLKDTVNDFWDMVIKHQVKVILMLTPLEEKDKAKSVDYWSDYLEKSEKIAPTITVNTLLVFDPETNDIPNVIKHIHYTGWPDFGTPPKSDIEILLSLIKTLWIDHSPMICHCSAGIGRTGVIASILRYLNTKGTESVLDIVKEIRKDRNGMVQTYDQFKFIHDFVEDLRLKTSVENFG